MGDSSLAGCGLSQTGQGEPTAASAASCILVPVVDGAVAAVAAVAAFESGVG